MTDEWIAGGFESESGDKCLPCLEFVRNLGCMKEDGNKMPNRTGCDLERRNIADPNEAWYLKSRSPHDS